MQKYPKSISTQKVSGTDTAPFLDYLCFIAGEFLFKIIPISNDSALLDLFGGTGWLFGFNECVCGMPCIIFCVSSYMNMVSKSEQDLA